MILQVGELGIQQAGDLGDEDWRRKLVEIGN
jgi:hypothetical protein